METRGRGKDRGKKGVKDMEKERDNDDKGFEGGRGERRRDKEERR